MNIFLFVTNNIFFKNGNEFCIIEYILIGQIILILLKKNQNFNIFYGYQQRIQILKMLMKSNQN